MKNMQAVRRYSALVVGVVGLALAPRPRGSECRFANNDYFNFIEARRIRRRGLLRAGGRRSRDQFNTDGLVGVRVTENFWNYFGLEQSFTRRIRTTTCVSEHQPNPNVNSRPGYSRTRSRHELSWRYLTPRDSARCARSLRSASAACFGIHRGMRRRLRRGLDPSAGFPALQFV